ncbi:MAG: ABC transporter permease, partial [Caldilineaceae bacterium]|nr:ABC transporter permease [Caldilineaceae bacterium]
VDPAREQSAGVVLGQVQAATAAMLIDAEVTRGVKQAFNTAPELMGVDDIDFDELGIDLEAVEKFLTAAIKGVVSSQVQDAMDDPLVRVAPQPASDVAPLRAPTVFDYVVPGYSVFFALFLMGLMAETVLQERLSGTLRRLFSLPLSRTAFLIGKILPYSLIAMVQIVLVLGMSSILFDYDLGQAPLALMLMIVATGLAVGSVGMMVAVLVRSEGQANSVPNLLTLVLAAVSGSMFPSIRLPGIENLTPNYWAIQGFLRITALQGTFDTVVLNIVVLLGMSVVAFAVAAWRFRYE